MKQGVKWIYHYTSPRMWSMCSYMMYPFTSVRRAGSDMFRWLCSGKEIHVNYKKDSYGVRGLLDSLEHLLPIKLDYNRRTALQLLFCYVPYSLLSFPRVMAPVIQWLFIWLVFLTPLTGGDKCAAGVVHLSNLRLFLSWSYNKFSKKKKRRQKEKFALGRELK